MEGIGRICVEWSRAARWWYVRGCQRPWHLWQENHVEWGARWEESCLKYPQIIRKDQTRSNLRERLDRESNRWWGLRAVSSVKDYSQFRGQKGGHGSGQAGAPGLTLSDSLHVQTGHMAVSRSFTTGTMATDGSMHSLTGCKALLCGGETLSVCSLEWCVHTQL